MNMLGCGYRSYLENSRSGSNQVIGISGQAILVHQPHVYYKRRLTEGGCDNGGGVSECHLPTTDQTAHPKVVPIPLSIILERFRHPASGL